MNIDDATRSYLDLTSHAKFRGLMGKVVELESLCKLVRVS